MKEQIPNIHLAGGCRLHAFSSAGPPLLQPSEGRQPLFTEVLHLAPPPRAAAAPQILPLFLLLTPVFRCLLFSVFGQKMQPCFMDFLRVLQVAGVLASKMTQIRLVEDCASPCLTLFIAHYFSKAFFYFILFCYSFFFAILFFAIHVKGFQSLFVIASSNMNNRVKQLAH